MSDVTITICFFLFVLAGVSAALLLFRRRAGESLATEQTSLSGGTDSGLLRSMLLLGQIAPKAKGTGDTDPTRNRLLAAGYRDPSAPLIFNGIRLASGLLCGVILWWVGLLGQESASVGLLLAVCGFGMGYVFPDMVLQARSTKRIGELEGALPNALDLMVLSVEAGQTLDAALMETSREIRLLYPELSGELAQVQLELRAGRARSEVLYSLGARTGSPELKKLATVMIDSDRFGTSLGPALRTHAKYLRTRRRHSAQEAARKLSVKLIFPVFFLIMPTVFVITLGPAAIQLYEALGSQFSK